MELDCNVVKDLLPLYYSGYSREGSVKLVRSHLDECEECRKIYEDLLASDIVEQVVFDEEKVAKNQDLIVRKAGCIKVIFTIVFGALTLALCIPAINFILVMVYSYLQG